MDRAIDHDVTVHAGMESLLRSLGDAVLLEDARRLVVFANEAFARTFLGGAPPESMLGVDCAAGARASAGAFRESSAWLERTERAVTERVPVRDELWQLVDGRWLERDYLPRFADGAFAGHAWVYRDVTVREVLRRERDDVAAELADLVRAATAPTGMPVAGNVVTSRSAIERALAHGPVAVAMAKIANLDRINGGLGRDAGDRVIAIAAARIAAAVPDALVERTGGATYTIVRPGRRSAAALMREVRAAIGTSVEVNAHTAVVRLAIGGTDAMPGTGTQDPRELLQQARLALSEARRVGRDLAFDDALVAGERVRDELGAALPAAIRDSALSLVYQPVRRLSDRGIVAHEALVRWVRPSSGTLTAATFVPIAEATGLAPELDSWVITRALAELPAVTSGLGGSRVGVNVSGQTLSHPGRLRRIVEEALARHAVAATSLVLELTETEAAADPRAARTELEALVALGIEIAIDDFGVGASSLALLKDIPFQYLKLDKAFTKGLDDARVRAVVAAACALAREFGAQVVAEGVESEAQLAPLSECGVAFGQGWQFGVPTSLPGPSGR